MNNKALILIAIIVIIGAIVVTRLLNSNLDNQVIDNLNQAAIAMETNRNADGDYPTISSIAGSSDSSLSRIHSFTTPLSGTEGTDYGVADSTATQFCFWAKLAAPESEYYIVTQDGGTKKNFSTFGPPTNFTSCLVF